MNVAELTNDYYLFGGKGDVWSGTAHIYESGKGNLCGKPALSTNWVHVERVQHAGCPTCIEKYKKQRLEKVLGFGFYEN
jgi:hypothetical protein